MSVVQNVCKSGLTKQVGVAAGRSKEPLSAQSDTLKHSPGQAAGYSDIQVVLGFIHTDIIMSYINYYYVIQSHNVMYKPSYLIELEILPEIV